VDLLGEITHQTRATGVVAASPLGVIEGFENVGMQVRLGQMA
jgi:hypothetical protein